MPAKPNIPILIIREQNVILDADLARLYGVPTRRLNEQVKRNADRFPQDFMFQLSPAEWGVLKSQFATSSADAGTVGNNRYKLRPVPSATVSPRAQAPLGHEESKKVE